MATHHAFCSSSSARIICCYHNHACHGSRSAAGPNALDVFGLNHGHVQLPKRWVTCAPPRLPSNSNDGRNQASDAHTSRLPRAGPYL